MFWTNGGRRILEATFPDGEKNIWGFTVQGRVSKAPNVDVYAMTQGDTLTWKWESDADFTTLLLLKNCYPNFEYLRILYLPYSREDRNSQKRSRCPLRYIGQFIQGLGFERVIVVDPHSDLTMAYLGENAEPIYPGDSLRYAASIESTTTPAVQEAGAPVVVMFPDAGAQKRYGDAWGRFPQFIGSKVRDFKTGKITGYTVAGGEIAKDKHVLIVDDLCSYGGTFILAGNALQTPEYRPSKITLVVTHCENSIFEGKIFRADSPIDRVVTTDSLIDPQIVRSHQECMILPAVPGRLTVIELPK